MVGKISLVRQIDDILIESLIGLKIPYVSLKKKKKSLEMHVQAWKTTKEKSSIKEVFIFVNA